MKNGKAENVLAVDFDGVLAKKLEPYHPDKVGPPQASMIKRVRKQLANGRKVVILTARVHSSNSPDELKRARHLIRNFCIQYLGKALPITAEKHPLFSEIWDDRAKQVDSETGDFVLHKVAAKAYKLLSSANSVQSFRG